MGLSLSGLMTVCQFGVQYKFVAVVQDEDEVDDEQVDEVEDDCFVRESEEVAGVNDDRGVAGGDLSVSDEHVVCGGGVEAVDCVNGADGDDDDDDDEVGCMKRKKEKHTVDQLIISKYKV